MSCPKQYWGSTSIVSQVDTLETIENVQDGIIYTPTKP
jgi:hypothetical protein